jgi:hypothetical protein
MACVLLYHRVFQLSAGNYCMQCFSSPTREEINRAHREGIWLDIGVPGIRNLNTISLARVLLWSLLGLSGIPLHLLYNGVVFSTLASNDYSVTAIYGDLLNETALPSPSTYFDLANSTLKDFRNASDWQRLDNGECIKAYAQPFVSARGDLLAISTKLNASRSTVSILPSSKIYQQPVGGLIVGANVAYAWICYAQHEYHLAPSHFPSERLQDSSGAGVGPEQRGMPGQPCDFNAALGNSANRSLVSIEGDQILPVECCISKVVVEHCRLQFSLIIMLVVIGCNL